MEKRLLLIGCGNMGEAILKGILDSSFIDPERIKFFEKDHSRAEYIRDTYGVSSADDKNAGLGKTRYILMAVKPQDAGPVIRELAGSFDREKNCIVSIIAGISTGYYERILGERASVIRVMPNTPALYKKGMITVSPGKYASNEDIRFVIQLMGKIGECIQIDESLQNISTAINGSGPAYFFLFCKAMTDAAIANGLEDETAKKLVAETMAGAGEMLKKSGLEADELIARVASPGGTTEKALQTFRESKLEHIVKDAVENALKRSKELEGEMAE